MMTPNRTESRYPGLPKMVAISKTELTRLQEVNRELAAVCKMAINTIDNAPNTLVDFVTDRIKTVKALKKALAGKGE